MKTSYVTLSALLLALVGCNPSSPEPKEARQGVAAEIRDDIAYVPRTDRRYTDPLTTHYWNGEYLQADYLDGRLHGTWTRYSADGAVLMRVCFEKANPIECRR